jgi:asparagine synthase (glutamine-hydrolysing)
VRPLLSCTFGAGPAHSAALPAFPSLARFAAGTAEVAHAAIVEIASDAGVVCLALGRPRFNRAADAARAQASGNASAWLSALRADGAAMLDTVHGRFAVAWLDTVARRALLACDRFGTWPLCFHAGSGGLAFSDRADAVALAERRLSEQALFDYLYFHMIPAPRTVYEGVQRLPAGHALVWNQGGVEVAPYWKPAFQESRVPDLAGAKQAFRDIVFAAVQREATGADVGCFLSGGTDSSTVAGMLCKALGHPARTYSIGFDAQGYDEMEYARIAARHFGTDHHEYYVTPRDLVDGIPTVAAHFDQPFGNSSAVPAWCCARAARDDGVERLLAGDGGDELFGGNTRYAKQRVFEWYGIIPAALRRGVVEPLLASPHAARVPILRKAASYVEQARVPLPDRGELYNLLYRLGLSNVFDPAFLAAVDTGMPAAMQRATWRRIDAHSTINRTLGFEWKYTLADNDLVKVVGATTLAGVDVAFPLLDEKLIEFSLGLPPAWKLKGLTLRWFFKEALRGFLPDAIIRKKKHGFGLPFGVWALGDAGLNALARDSLRSLADRGIMNREFLRDLADRWLREHPAYYGEMLWIAMMLEQWMRVHAPEWRFSR